MMFVDDELPLFLTQSHIADAQQILLNGKFDDLAQLSHFKDL